MTGGDIAGLIAAGVFAVLVALLAVPILKLGKVFDELRLWIRDLNSETEPLIDEVVRTVATTNSQLAKVDGITDNVSDASANVSAMTSLVASTVGQPIIKVAAFSSGVRQAFSPEAARLRREETRRMRAAAAAEAARREADETSGRPRDTTTEPMSAAGASPTDGTATDSTGANWWDGTEWDQDRTDSTTETQTASESEPESKSKAGSGFEPGRDTVEDQVFVDHEGHDVIDVEYSSADVTDTTDTAGEPTDRDGLGRSAGRSPRHREEDR